MKKLKLISALALAFPAVSWGATLYFSDCGAGAVAACVAGDDTTGNGTQALPYKSIAKAWTLWNALPAGSSILWARGSDQTSSAIVSLDNRNCTNTIRCTLGAYTPSWLNLTDSGNTSAISASTVTDGSKSWTVNQWVGYSVRMRTAFGSMIELPIASNTATVLTLGRNFPENPAAVTAYTIQGQKPILRSSTGTIIQLSDSGNADHNEGTTISNLRLIQTTAASSTIVMSNDEDYTIIDSIEIENSTTIGVQFDGGQRHTANPGSDGISDHFVLRDSYIHDNKTIGALLDGNYVLVEGNTFQFNGTTSLDHSLYLDDQATLSGAAPSSLKNVVRHNTFIDGHYGGPGGCAGTNIVTHGRKDGLIIEHNLLKETTLPTSNQCIGIAADAGYSGATFGNEGFSDVAIRNNHIINYSRGIGLDICHDCVIENNEIYSEVVGATVFTVTGIAMRDKNFVPGSANSSSTIDGKGSGSDDSANPDFQPTRIRIRNNTVYLTAPDGNSIGIALNGNVSDDLTGSGYELVSNIVYLGGTATTGTGCFDTRNITVASFTAMDYNLCYSTVGVKWDLARSTLAANQGVGFDTHSLTSNPQIATPASNGYSLAIPTGSPAKNSGHPTKSSALAFGNVQRDATPDIGAFEFGASGVVPYAPVWGSAQ